MKSFVNNNLNKIVIGGVFILGTSLLLGQMKAKNDKKKILTNNNKQNQKNGGQKDETQNQIDLEIKRAKFITMFQELQKKNRLQLLELLENEGQSIRKRFGMSAEQAKYQVLSQDKVMFQRSKIQEEVFKQFGFTQKEVDSLINNEFRQDMDVQSIINEVLDQIEMSASGEVVPLLSKIPEKFRDEEFVYELIRETLLKQALFLQGKIQKLMNEGQQEYMKNPQIVSEIATEIQKIKLEMLEKNGLGGQEDSAGRIYKVAIKELSQNFQQKYYELANKYQEVSTMILTNNKIQVEKIFYED